MYKGKGAIAYSILKIVLYAVGFYEYLFYSSYENNTMIKILFLVLLVNSLFRQFYLYGKENLRRYGLISIILDYLLGIYLAYLGPVPIAIMVLTPAIIESVTVYSLLFGGSISVITLITLVILDILSRRRIYDYYFFFRSMMVSYGLGFFLILVVSYLASQQLRERERVTRANRELEEAYELLLNHASKLQELSVEKERNRMAREIHDTLAHTLTALVVQLEAGKKLIDIDTFLAKAEIEKAQALTRTGLSELKGTIKALRPQMLENRSLTDAVHNLIQDIKERTDVKIQLRENVSNEPGLSPAAEVALFRVIQESITNSVRHGNADQIDIAMTEQGNTLCIAISDNGKGCAHIKEGYGLKGITERIKGLNGTVRFTSAEGEGFRTAVTIPSKGGIAG